jgi:DNA-binding NtrC family response regulator
VVAVVTFAVAVLFVDDEPDQLRAVVRELQDAPFEVLTAATPTEALALLERRRVDVLVADVDMPEMNGLELVRIARRDHPETVRMLLTAHATMERALRAINEGEVLRFFTKPFDGDLFEETVAALLDRIRQLRREGEAASRSARRRDLYDWLDGRFPGASSVERNTLGEVVIDVPSLLAAIEATGPSALHDLLRRDG